MSDLRKSYVNLMLTNTRIFFDACKKINLGGKAGIPKFSGFKFVSRKEFDIQNLDLLMNQH